MLMLAHTHTHRHDHRVVPKKLRNCNQHASICVYTFILHKYMYIHKLRLAHTHTHTGMAIEWFLKNFATATNVLVLGTGLSSRSKAVGSNGAAFWASYIQKKLPSANVRVAIDSSMAVLGPKWNGWFQNDQWGTTMLRTPDMVSMLMPPPKDWFIGADDMSAYYEYVSRTTPSIAFADVSSVDDSLQTALFQVCIYMCVCVCVCMHVCVCVYIYTYIYECLSWHCVCECFVG